MHDRPSNAFVAGIVAVAFCAGIVISLVLATAGEPTSVWFWRDVLGVLQ